jgi:hypothetical protein
MNKAELLEALSKIQQALKVPKVQYNTFSKFYYRSCGDILEAVKPLLQGLVLVLDDEIVVIGDRYYVKATASLFSGTESVVATAYARESLDKTGMADAQLTGATSSYARKYALNGLFAIDDEKDPDTMDNTKKEVKSVNPMAEVVKELTASCPIHNVPLGHYSNEKGEWWSHKIISSEGVTSYCNGKVLK